MLSGEIAGAGSGEGRTPDSEKAEMERKLTVINTLGISFTNRLSPSPKRVEFSTAPALKQMEFLKQEELLSSTSPSPAGHTDVPGPSNTTSTPPPLLTRLSTDREVTGSAKGAKVSPTTAGVTSSSTKDGSSTPVRRRSSPTGALMNEIRKMSLSSQDAKEERQIKRFRRFHGRRRNRKEEEYTDKDRAAAVTLGSRDIKQSLRAKKKRERKLCVSIDLLNREDFLSEMLLNEATHQMRIKDINMALNTLNKALELQPTHKAALVARSQCHLKLGDALSALKDAETTCDKREMTYITGLFQYAEALYNLGQFEKALIAYHRGYRLRKDMEGFRIGVQKSQEAIQKSIGDHSATQIEDLEEILPIIYEMETFKNQKSQGNSQTSVAEADELLRRRFNGKLKAPSKTRSRWVSREVLGQMYLDKDYLSKFLTRADIQKDHASSDLRENATEALNYLEIREEFWRQQNPMYARKSGFNLNNKMVLEYEDLEAQRKESSRRPKKSPASVRSASNVPNANTKIKPTKVINPTIRVTELLK